jgi:YgiT-type zinc finger domain-containing protein
MKCPLCETGNMKEGTATFTLEKGDAVIVFRDVPALVCDQCRNKETSEEVTGELLRRAREIALEMAAFGIKNTFLQYAA